MKPKTDSAFVSDALGTSPPSPVTYVQHPLPHLGDASESQNAEFFTSALDIDIQP